MNYKFATEVQPRLNRLLGNVDLEIINKNSDGRRQQLKSKIALNALSQLLEQEQCFSLDCGLFKRGEL